MKRATVTNPLIYKDTGDFNPRPHEEGDAALQPQSLTLVISIHALMKRATAQAALPYLDTIISIHALMKRATSITGNRGLWQIFQSTPS